MTTDYTPDQRAAKAVHLVTVAIDQVADQTTKHMVTWAHGYATATITNARLFGDLTDEQDKTFTAQLKRVREATLQTLADRRGCPVDALPERP